MSKKSRPEKTREKPLKQTTQVEGKVRQPQEHRGRRHLKAEGLAESVMAALGSWMAGSSPAMTKDRRKQCPFLKL